MTDMYKTWSGHNKNWAKHAIMMFQVWYIDVMSVFGVARVIEHFSSTNREDPLRPVY